MKAGAVEFLTKPLRDQDLLDAIQPRSAAIARGWTTSEKSPICGRVTNR